MLDLEKQNVLFTKNQKNVPGSNLQALGPAVYMYLMRATAGKKTVLCTKSI